MMHTIESKGELQMKEYILNKLELGIASCKINTEGAILQAKKGKIELAINHLEIAVAATKCVNNAHDELWEETKGELTNEEFELFAEAETLYFKILKAHKEILKAQQGGLKWENYQRQ